MPKTLEQWSREACEDNGKSYKENYQKILYSEDEIKLMKREIK